MDAKRKRGMRVICPGCHRRLRAPEKALGHRIKCPRCKVTFRVSMNDCVGGPEGVSSSVQGSQVSTSERQFKWAMIISAAALAGVATMIITVFVTRNWNSQEPRKLISKLNGRGARESETLDSSRKLFDKEGSKTTDRIIKGLIKPKDVISPNLNISDLVEAVDRSICKIETDLGGGTGFMIAENLVLTNEHVVNFWSELKCYFPGEYEGYQAEIVWVNPDVDVALLKLPKGDPAPIDISKCPEIKRGERVVIIGYPGTSGRSVSSTVTAGILSNKTGINGTYFYQTDAAVNSGNSGGPVFDTLGRVIGIATLKEVDKENVGYVLPISYANSEFVDFCNANEGEIESRLAWYAHNADCEAIKAGCILAIAMLADLESAWADAIRFGTDISEAVHRACSKHNTSASILSYRIRMMDRSSNLYGDTLSVSRLSAIKAARGILVEAFEFVNSPSGSYKRFEDYWPARIAELNEAVKKIE